MHPNFFSGISIGPLLDHSPSFEKISIQQAVALNAFIGEPTSTEEPQIIFPSRSKIGFAFVGPTIPAGNSVWF